MISIQPAYSIFVDESGTPSLGTEPGAHCKGYVASAVCVPEIDREPIEKLLPRTQDGRLLKFADQDMREVAVFEFLHRLFQWDVHVSAVLFQLDSPRNIEHADRLVRHANKRRGELHNPRVNEARLIYMYCTNWAVLTAWARASVRTGNDIGYFDLVFDDGSVTNKDKRVLQDSWRHSFADLNATCRDIRWTNEHEQPLLNVPDIVAGVCRRQAERGDVTRAWGVLETAEKRGQLYIQDGFDAIYPEDEAG